MKTQPSKCWSGSVSNSDVGLRILWRFYLIILFQKTQSNVGRYRNSIALIQYARRIAASQINLVQLMTYYALGRWIVEEQQSGEHRAGYGKKVIQTLSNKLNAEFGKGFSVDTLENARKFYLWYQERISEAAFRKFTEGKSEAVFRIFDEPIPFTLLNRQS